MSSIYTLSTYSLATISAQVVANSSTPTIIWSASIPAGAKGKNAILQLFFNMYWNTNFFANQSFFYGLYVDGVPLAIGDSTTMKYVHTAATPYAISAAGVGLGTNPLFGYQPLVIPLAISPTASQIQLGITNSTLALPNATGTTPAYTTATLTSSGTLNTGDFIPKSAFTTAGTFTYVVPTTCSMGAVQGVYVYLWGCGGSTANTVNSNGAGGGGGFTTGFYSCAGGTSLYGVVGDIGTQSLNTGAGGNAYGGGFSGLFTSSVLNTSTVIAIAGGGGGTGNQNIQGGGSGGGSNGGLPYNAFSNIPWTGITAATQTSGGTGLSNAGQWYGNGGGPGGNAFTAGGGGWYGGTTTTNSIISGGGSGFTSNLTSGGVTSNGTTLQTSLTPGTQNQFVQAGGAAVMTALGFSPATYGWGGYNNTYGKGLVILIPAIGTTAVQVGVSASLYAL